MKKLTCHCGAIEAEVKIPIGGVEKIMIFSTPPIGILTSASIAPQ